MYDSAEAVYKRHDFIGGDAGRFALPFFRQLSSVNELSSRKLLTSVKNVLWRKIVIQEQRFIFHLN